MEQQGMDRVVDLHALPRLCAATDAPQRLFSSGELARVTTQRVDSRRVSQLTPSSNGPAARKRLEDAEASSQGRPTSSCCAALPSSCEPSASVQTAVNDTATYKSRDLDTETGGEVPRRPTAVSGSDEAPPRAQADCSFLPDGSFSSETSDSEDRGFDSLFFRIIDVEAAAAAEQLALRHACSGDTPTCTSAGMCTRAALVVPDTTVHVPVDTQCSGSIPPTLFATSSDVSVTAPSRARTPRGADSCDGWMGDLRSSPPPAALERLQSLREAGRQVQQKRARGRFLCQGQGDDNDGHDMHSRDAHCSYRDHHTSHNRTHRAHARTGSTEPPAATSERAAQPSCSSCLSGPTTLPAQVRAKSHRYVRTPPSAHPCAIHAPLVDGDVDVPMLLRPSGMDSSVGGAVPSTSHSATAAGSWTTTHANRAPSKHNPHRPASACVGELRTRSREYSVFGHDRETGLLRPFSVVHVEELEGAVRKPVALLEQVAFHTSSTSSPTSTPSKPHTTPHSEPCSPQGLTSYVSGAARARPRGARRAVSFLATAVTALAPTHRGSRHHQPPCIDEEDDDESDTAPDGAEDANEDDGEADTEAEPLARTQPSACLREEAEARFSETSGATSRGLRLLQQHVGEGHARSPNASSAHIRAPHRYRSDSPVGNTTDVDDSPLLRGGADRVGETSIFLASTTSSPSLLAHTPILDISGLLERHSPSGTPSASSAHVTAGAAKGTSRSPTHTETSVDGLSSCTGARHETPCALFTPNMASLTMSSLFIGNAGVCDGNRANAALSASEAATGSTSDHGRHQRVHQQHPQALSPNTAAVLRGTKVATSSTSTSSDSTSGSPSHVNSSTTESNSAVAVLLSPGACLMRCQPCTPEMARRRVSASPLLPDEANDEALGQGNSGSSSSDAVDTSAYRTSVPQSTSGDPLSGPERPPALSTQPVVASNSVESACTTTNRRPNNVNNHGAGGPPHTDRAVPEGSAASRLRAIPPPPSLPAYTTVPAPPQVTASSAPTIPGAVARPTPMSGSHAHVMIKAGTSSPHLIAATSVDVKHMPSGLCGDARAGDAFLSAGLSTSGGGAGASARQDLVVPSAAGQLLRFTPIDLSGSVRLLSVSHNSNSSRASSFSLPLTDTVAESRPLFATSQSASDTNIHTQTHISRLLHGNVSLPSFSLAPPPLSPEVTTLRATPILQQVSRPLPFGSGAVVRTRGPDDSNGSWMSMSSSHSDQSPLSVPLSPRHRHDAGVGLAHATAVADPCGSGCLPGAVLSSGVARARPAGADRSHIPMRITTRSHTAYAPPPLASPTARASNIGPVILSASRSCDAAGDTVALRSPIATTVVPDDPLLASHSDGGPLFSVDSDPLGSGGLEGDHKGDDKLFDDAEGDTGDSDGVQCIAAAPAIATATQKPRVTTWPAISRSASLSTLNASTASRASSNPLSPDDDGE